ncbi:MAG: flavodoxin domain-containing protein [Promethearchaeati archaeon]
MDEKNVLILFGTRYGTTGEIVEKMTEYLKDMNISTENFNLKEINSNEIPKISEYGGLIIGTGMKINKWTKYVRNYIKDHQEMLQNRTNKFGMFTCGAFAIGQPEKAKEDLKQRLMEDYGLEPDHYEAFGGVLDLSDDSNLGFLDKKMLKVASKAMKEEDGVEVKPDARNDFRDWEKIKTFTQEFGKLL